MMVATKKEENLKQPLRTSNTASWDESALLLVTTFSVIHSLSGRTSLWVRGPSCVECSIWDLFEKDQNGMFSDFRENMVMSEEKWNE